MTNSTQRTKKRLNTPVLALVVTPLLASCGASSEDVEALGSVTQAVCSGSNPVVTVNSYQGEHGISRDAVYRNYNAVGRLAKNGCSGAFLAGPTTNSYYLSSGDCNYKLNDSIQIDTTAYTVTRIVKQRKDSLNYALVTLTASQGDTQHGMFRLGKRAPVVGENIGTFRYKDGNDFFVGGKVSGALSSTKLSHNLNANSDNFNVNVPTDTFEGAPIVDKDGFLIAVNSESCGATRIDKILADLPQVERDELTQMMPCTGSTTMGSTAWVGAGVTDVIRVNIDTSACGFATTPLYFTSLVGNYDVDGATSATAIYDGSSTGFRVNVQRAGLTPQAANAAGYVINWSAFPRDYNDPHDYRCSGNTPSTNWKAYNSKIIYRDVNIPSSCKTVTPGRVFFTSLVGSAEHRTASGVNTIYRKTDDSFRVYLHREAGVTPNQASGWNWAINWLASDGHGAGRVEVIGRDGGFGYWWPWYNGAGIDTYNGSGGEWQYIPRYFTSLVINNEYQLPPLNGVSNIQFPGWYGFQIKVDHPGYTSAEAETYWTLEWAARP